MLQVVGLVADLTELVRDPELEPVRAVGREARDDVLLGPVLEDEPHVALRDGPLLVLRGAGLTHLLLLDAGLLRLLLLVLVLRLDEAVVEVAGARVLVLLKEVAEVAVERVELRQAARDVRVDLHVLLERLYEVTAPLGERVPLGLGRIDALVATERREGVDRHQDARDDEEEDAALGGCALLLFHAHDLSAPLPALERAESDEKRDDRDRDEVDDRPCVDEPALERRVARLEAQERGDVAEDALEELRRASR